LFIDFTLDIYIHEYESERAEVNISFLSREFDPFQPISAAKAFAPAKADKE
jgi:hypothetical protein